MKLLQMAFRTWCLWACSSLWGQSVIPLNEVVVTDRRLSEYSDGYAYRVLADSVFRAQRSMAQTLADETLVFVRENGRGMVASPSMRGTSASHTALIWNGINVNSPLNGQIDLNNWVLQHADPLVLRSGGGSVLFGSGAIGGSIHLESPLRFEREYRGQTGLGYGSFDSRQWWFRQEGGGRRWAVNWGLTAQDSENDYPFPGQSGTNQNGAFENLSWTVNAARKLSGTSTLQLYHMGHTGDRQLSGTVLAPSENRYRDVFSRTQWAWEQRSEAYLAVIRLAHLFEQYRFYESADGPLWGQGSAHTWLGRYEGTLKRGSRLEWHHFLQVSGIQAEGRNVPGQRRTDYALSSLVRFRPVPVLSLGGSLRKEWSTDFDSPLLFTLQGAWALGDQWKVRANAGRNFRSPTVNDLHWQPGGNPALRPENSMQWEFGLDGQTRAWSWGATAYWIRSRDLIRWLPGTDGIWSPENTDRVWIQGLEGSLTAVWIKTRRFEATASVHYGFTRSIDRRDQSQLAYTPVHQGRLRLEGRFPKGMVYLRQVVTGEVETPGEDRLPAWQRWDAGLSRTWGKPGALRWELGLHLRNLGNTYYEPIAFRPMPGREIHSQLIFHF